MGKNVEWKKNWCPVPYWATVGAYTKIWLHIIIIHKKGRQRAPNLRYGTEDRPVSDDSYSGRTITGGCSTEDQVPDMLQRLDST